MIVVEQSDNRGVLYSTITRKGYHIMIPVVAAGTMGLRILKTLYKGKKKIGAASKMAADKAGKAGFTDKAHLKAKGLIPRADGTKKKSDKYK